MFYMYVKVISLQVVKTCIIQQKCVFEKMKFEVCVWILDPGNKIK